LEQAQDPVADIALVELPADVNLQAEKPWLLDPTPDRRHLALVVMHDDAVRPRTGTSAYGTYDIYVPPNLDDRVETLLHDGLREAILSARLATQDLDRAQLEAMMRVPRPASMRVAAGVEQQNNAAFNRIVPFAFAGLLVFSVMIGGQTLLTQTIEEKSSRVVEVLLSAVSPLQLMAGKILGQMAVSLLVLLVYAGLGLAMLASFAMMGLFNPLLAVYLVVFFLIGYLTFASVFAAVGAAVNEMREAQTLMMPIMLVLTAPWLFGPAISRAPNATFSVVLSFLPPVNTFAMMNRLASSSPPPFWQVLLTIAVGLAATVGTMWIAGKVFKIGLLMHGKPPSLATLLRWARSA
jgi:ABC-type Na+ efflux pump permease subunit